MVGSSKVKGIDYDGRKVAEKIDNYRLYQNWYILDILITKT